MQSSSFNILKEKTPDKNTKEFNVLIIRTNTTYRFSTIFFNYTEGLCVVFGRIISICSEIQNGTKSPKLGI